MAFTVMRTSLAAIVLVQLMLSATVSGDDSKEYKKTKPPSAASNELDEEQNYKLNDKEDIGLRADLCIFGSGDYTVPDCRFYLHCVGLRAYVSRCPGGYVFDPASRQCDWPSKNPSCLSNGKYEVPDTHTTPASRKLMMTTENQALDHATFEKEVNFKRSTRSIGADAVTFTDQFANMSSTWNKIMNKTEEMLLNITRTVQNLVPVGSIVAYYQDGNPPECWLRCNGSAFQKENYPLLASLLTQTNTPNLHGKFLMGVEERESSRSWNLVGKTGGEAMHVLTRSEMPDHSHAIHPWTTASAPLASPVVNTEREFRLKVDAVSNAERGHFLPFVFDTSRGQILSTYDSGVGMARNNLPPFMTISYIIRAC